MKKLMIAVAASIAAVGAFAVVSDNVVGYNQKTLSAGQNMITASFVVPGGTTFKVSDLKIVGYQNDPAFVNAWGYGASFFVLDTFGRCLNEQGKFFQYGDNLVSDDPIEWEGGVWLDAEGNPVVADSANDLVLDAGDSVWLTAQESSAGFSQGVQTSGQVLGYDYGYNLVAGQNAVGNPMAANVYLSDLIIRGYQNDPVFVDAWGYGASFFVLDAFGRCLNEQGKFFQYGDNLVSDDPIEWEGGVWLDAEGNPVEAKGANDLVLTPGDGVWFTAQGSSAGFTQQLVFPTALK